MSFVINQIFLGDYPPDAAAWCNKNRAYIEEIAPVTREETKAVQISGYVYDSDGNLICEPKFEEKTVEVTVRRFQIVAIPEPTKEEIAAQALAQAKAERAALVEKATVEVDGLIFDADETSQNRLARGITAALALGLGPDETTEWTLADNSSAQVTVQQMARALLAAGQYQTSVWRMPYEATNAEPDQPEA